MKIVAIAGSRIPSDTANSIQVMKACQALVQLGHELTLIVPANPSSIQHPPIGRNRIVVRTSNFF